MASYTEWENEIIKKQIERRKKYRHEFLKMRTDPCAHSRESGYVFDPAYQRYASMKCTQYEYFKATPKTSIKGALLVVVPMFLYGWAIHQDRSTREEKIRCGQIKYKDRLFKMA